MMTTTERKTAVTRRRLAPEARQAAARMVVAANTASEARDRLLELKYIIEGLAEVYEDEGIEIWLHARQRSLDGKSPLELLRDGQFDTVLEVVDRLAGGPRR